MAQITIPYKIIRFDQVQNNLELKQPIIDFLNSTLSSNFANNASVGVPIEIKTILYFGPLERIDKNQLKIDTLTGLQVENDEEKTKQIDKLRLEDIAGLIIQIRSWLRKVDFVKDKKILEEAVFENVEAITDGKLQTDFAGKENNLKEAIGTLLEAVGDTTALAKEENAASLREIIDVLRSGPEQALTEKTWDDYVFPLARDFKNATPQEKSFTTNLESLNPKKALVKETRLAFHHFLMSLKKAIEGEDRSKLPGPNKGKSLLFFLTTTEVKKIKDIENQAFFFPEQTDDVTTIATDPDAYSGVTDKNKIEAFWQFFVKEKVMDRILGNDDLDPTIIATQTETEEAAEGGEAADLEEEIEEIKEIKEKNLAPLLEKLAEQYHHKTVQALRNHKRLEFVTNLKEYPELSEEEKTQARKYVFQNIKDYILSKKAIRDYLSEQDFFPKEGKENTEITLKNDEEGNFILSPEFLTWLEEDVAKYANNILDQIIEYNVSLINYVQSLVEKLFPETAKEPDITAEETEIDEDEAIINGSVLPENLDALKAEYQTYLDTQGSILPKGANFVDVWLAMSIDERRRFLNSLRAKQGFLIELNLNSTDIRNISISLDALLILTADYQEFINNLNSAEDVRKYFGVIIAPEDLAEFKTLLLKLAEVKFVHLTHKALETKAKAETLIEVKQTIIDYGPARANLIYNSPLDQVQSNLSEKPQEGVYDPVAETHKREREAFETIIQTWFTLPEEKRREIYKTIGQDPGPELIIPTGLTSGQLLALLGSDNLQDAKQPRWKRILRRPQPIKQAKSRITKAISGQTQPSLRKRVQKALIKNPIKQTQKTYDDFKKLAIGAKLGTVLMTIVPALGSWLGLAGTIIGGYVAGLPGAMLGGWAGLGIDQALGKFGPHSWAGRPIDRLFPSGSGPGGGAGLKIPEIPGITGTTPTTIPVITPAELTTGLNPTITFMFGTGAVVTTAAVINMITMGAFLQPLPTIDQEGKESPYLKIDKTVAGSETFSEPADISYNITLTPKTDPNTGKAYVIEIISAPTDEFSLLLNKEANPDQPEPTLPASESYDAFKAGLTSLPGTQVTSASQVGDGYTLPFGSNNEPKNAEGLGPYDHLGVSNIFSVNFNVYLDDGSGNLELVKENQIATGSRSVCFGECPVSSEGCFVFGPAGKFFPISGGGVTSQEWTVEDKGMIAQSFKRAGESQRYTSLLCSGGPITLYRFPLSSQGYGGWAISTNAIGLYEISFKSVSGLEYTLIHESGHIIDFRNGNGAENSIRWRFGNETGYGGCFTYPFTDEETGACPTGEAFPEGIALYVVGTEYPFSTHPEGAYDMTDDIYNWFKENIFGGTTFNNGLPK